jgi:UDP:flavonoid glycosyltransferase YjiC (YdhE family)
MLSHYPLVHTLKPMISFLGILRREIRKQLLQLPDIIAGADLVLGASLCCGLHSVAESAGIPYGYVAMAPQILPSAHHPFVALKSQNLPPWLNRLSWDMARLMDRMNFTALLNKERRGLNLAPVKDILHHILGRHVIVASDPVLAEVPPDVSVDYVQTGYMHLQTRQRMSERLEKFLSAGSAPIYYGFGSMSTREQESLVALILTSLRRTGQRGVLSGFRFDETGVTDSENYIFLEDVPHPLLFPRLAAVVHHGGSGTTATAALAGVPQIIVPHILDQYYWGERVLRCGLGPTPIRRSQLTAERLSSAINQCVEGPGYYDRASRVAEEIGKQDSLRLAVDYLEKTYFNR